MLVVNYSEFRNKLKSYLDSVEHDNETLIIKRNSGSGTVLLSLEEYNSMMETMHLLGSRKNRNRLLESIEQAEGGNVKDVEL